MSHSPFYAFYSGSPFVLNQVGVQTSASLYVPTLLDLKYTLPDDIVLRSLTGYTYSYSRSAGATGYTSDNTGYSTQDVQPDWSWTQEFDVLSPTMWRTSFVAGAIFNYRFTPARNFIQSFLPPYSVATPQTTLADFATTVRGEGIFGNVVFQWTPTLQATLGLRENWDNEFNGGLGSIITSPSPPLPVASVRQVLSAGQAIDNRPTGKVGLNWAPNAMDYFYVFAARGYKAAGVATSGVTFLPEEINDYELGWKGKFSDGHLLTQLAASSWITTISSSRSSARQAPVRISAIFRARPPSTASSFQSRAASAPTKSALLQPLRDRMRLVLHFDFYTDGGAGENRHAPSQVVGVAHGRLVAAPGIAQRARGTARLALRLLPSRFVVERRRPAAGPAGRPGRARRPAGSRSQPEQPGGRP